MPSFIARALILFEIYRGHSPQAQKLKKSPSRIGLRCKEFWEWFHYDDDDDGDDDDDDNDDVLYPFMIYASKAPGPNRGPRVAKSSLNYYYYCRILNAFRSIKFFLLFCFLSAIEFNST